MNSTFQIQSQFLSVSLLEKSALAPYWVLFGGTALLVILAVTRVGKNNGLMAALSSVTVLASLYCAFFGMKNPAVLAFNQMLMVDPFSNLFNCLYLIAALGTILSSAWYLNRENLAYPEYYLLILFSTLGMMLFSSSMDLIVLFISLELMSLSIYILVGFRRADRKSNEAALKYFIMGSAASAILLYGIALLYGNAASFNLDQILEISRTSSKEPSFVLGIWLLTAGFLFKVAAFPFHMWSPDVYEGAPTPITGFMVTGVKAASFAALIRIFSSTGNFSDSVQALLYFSAVATILYGNLVALSQTNLKRMLAYSSIAHTGYLLIGLISAPHSDSAYSSMALYLVTYVAMNIGTFTLLTALSGKGDIGLNLNDLSGLYKKHPILSLFLAVFLFSMAGIPPTAGFAAKYALFYSAVQAKEIPLVLVGVAGSLISVGYYLRVLVYLFMREPSTPTDEWKLSYSKWSLIPIALAVWATLQVGLMPSRLLELTKASIASFKL